MCEIKSEHAQYDLENMTTSLFVLAKMDIPAGLCIFSEYSVVRMCMSENRFLHDAACKIYIISKCHSLTLHAEMCTALDKKVLCLDLNLQDGRVP